MSGVGAAGLAVVAVGALLVSASAAPPHASIDGTYELTKRVLADGQEIHPPSIMALSTLIRGHGNFNLFVKGDDGKIASESMISRYTFTDTKYCEWIIFTIRNNIGREGVTNQPPAATEHCSEVTAAGGKFTFTPPAQGGVVLSYDPTGFSASLPGVFVDYGRKVR